MSHQIKVEGSFGSVDCLKDVLRAAGQKFEESKEGGETFLVLQRPYNPIRMCVSSPSKSTVDHMNLNEVNGWYRDATSMYVKQRLLIDGHQVTSEVRQGQNIVLRVAVG